MFLPNIESKEEMLDLCKLLYRVNKHSLALDCHHEDTAAVVHKNYRMGIGVTGVLQATNKVNWLSWVYEQLREYDKEYSKLHGFPESIKLTTVKPSGTLSLLPGVTPGIHPGYAQYMIRRIRMSSSSPLVELCKKHGYPVEYVKRNDGTDDRLTVVVEFPFAYPEGTVLASDTTALDQLKWVKSLQEIWSDNAVSCTIYYRPEELPEIREYLEENYNSSFKSLSFLLHSDHGFVQAPFEEISEEEYNKRVASSTVIGAIEESDGELDLTAECEGGVCPIR